MKFEAAFWCRKGQVMKPILDELDAKREQARAGGGAKRIERQHEKHKLTARERLNVLLDEGSFEEWDMFVEHRCTDFGMTVSRPGIGAATTLSDRPVWGSGICSI